MTDRNQSAWDALRREHDDLQLEIDRCEETKTALHMNLRAMREDRDGLAAQVEVMRTASAGLLDRYVGLVECGDCGNWNCETEPQVIAARAALALPNTAAAILRQRDARVLREAALQLDSGDDVTIRILNCMADDMENGK